ncbi:hypothetical protein V500_02544 [Pseudogymnoascus sp. VKM F-4518 (FW-2643)]|nr:hypothetical protein V500_02544 [Pseudogymnoascus sp. VKM F-4518 (FW-2643)]
MQGDDKRGATWYEIPPSACGDEDATKLLVRSGIHLWTTAHSVAPLVYASEGGHESIVRYLLYDALNIWQRDAPQRTMTFEEWNRVTIAWDEAERQWTLHKALSRAAEGGHLAVVELLCQHVDVGVELGPSALHNAANQGHLALVLDILSRRPMDVSNRDSDGQTPLHKAARRHHLAVFYRHDDVIKILGDMPISAPPPTDDESYAPIREEPKKPKPALGENGIASSNE